MSYDGAMEALSNDALKLIRNDQVIGLGSGRAATSLVKSLGKLIKPKEEIVKEIVQPKSKVEDKVEIIQSISPKPEISFENKPDLDKEVAKITEHKALPQPEQKPKVSTIDDEFDEDTDDLDKIKGDIMRVLSKLDQAEVE